MSHSRKILRGYGAQALSRLPPGTDAHELGQALSQSIRREPPDMLDLLRKYFQNPETELSHIWEHDPSTGIIRQEAVGLVRKFHDFYQAFPENERVDLKEFVPTIEGVIDQVKQIHLKREAKTQSGMTGRTKRFFHRFCGTINTHKSMLGILPEGNEYISIFTGVLHVVIQASDNHEKLAEGIGESLSIIGECIEDIQIDAKLFPTEPMLRLVSEFYGQIFIFLSELMDWIMAKKRKRILKSFNDDLVATFQKDLDRIVKRADRILRRAAQSSRAEGQFVRHKIESIDDRVEDTRLGSTGLARQLAEREYFEERLQLQEARIEAYRREDLIRQERLGLSLKLLLQENLRSDRTPQLLFGIAEALPGENPRYPTAFLENPGVRELFDDIETRSASLEDHFCRDQVRPRLESDQPLPFEPDVILRVKEWSQDTASSLLWLSGPFIEVTDSSNPLTLLASRVIDLADEHHLNVISYFCHIRHTNGTISREEQSLVALLYALIRQLVELLPPRFDSERDLSKERFSRLGGTIASWEESLDVMEDILSLVPGTAVFCIIDGLDVLDHRSIRRPLTLLLGRIRQSSPKLKVLFTTSGRCYCLGQEIKAHENIVIDNFRDGLATYDLAL
ncbi:hypothetical protein KVR01_012134 [Diaporthe batatas]|uniref:uncharacterized protein n=1 Tax=Diaporthe batatas TaxID=748121 RepID=UPI001D04D674|nr:uncharacterized protein KVR01_012134 [Diaporthe batatas]KAG8157862.1 hypothetical protein KVR01_012134 [Diaporthe batatas]